MLTVAIMEIILVEQYVRILVLYLFRSVLKRQLSKYDGSEEEFPELSVVQLRECKTYCMAERQLS